MKNYLLFKIFLACIFPYTLTFSQIELISYDQKGNQIEAEILIKRGVDDDHVIVNNEDPSKFIFQKYDFFIALPEEEFNYKVVISEESNVNFSINKKYKLVSNYEFGISRELYDEEVKAEEVLLYRGKFIYQKKVAAHFTVNPIVNTIGVISEIKRIKIIFTFKKNIPESKLNSSTKSKFFINEQYSDEYQINNTSEDSSFSWVNMSQDYLKLGVAADGIYRVTYNNLLQMNVNAGSINPNSFNIYLRGERIPIYVYGSGDNQFNPGDYIEFAGMRNMGGEHRKISEYGTPYNEYLNLYSDTTIYWLTWGESDVSRVDTTILSTISVDTLDYYTQIFHDENNSWFDFSMADQIRRQLPYWYENKTWGWTGVGVGTRSFNFNLQDVYPGIIAKIFMKFQSYASSVNTESHLVSMSINSHLERFDSSYIDKFKQKVMQGELLSSSLINGTNTIRLHSYATASTVNTLFFDWYEVEYPRYLKAFNGDSLKFQFSYVTQKEKRNILISNFNMVQNSVWRYKDGYKKIITNGVGGNVLFADSVSSKSEYSIIAENKIQTPRIYYVKRFKDLRNTQNRADYIAITHKHFSNKVNEYVNFIEANYQVETKLVDIDDIFDEYAYGFFNPEAIKSFLQSTHMNWQQPLPKYVNLIGAANYDYHYNKYKFQAAPIKYNFVPSYGNSASDNWFIIWDSTGMIPQMNIGRIPAESVDELDHYFLKHNNYLTQDYDDWNKKYLFFSGGTGNNQAQLDQLREVNNYVINNFVSPAPIGGNASHFYKTTNPVSNFGPFSPAEVQNKINEGAVFISYLGHSGTQTWDNSITSPTQLRNNRNKNPLITDFGCSTVRFAEPDVISFSQLFVVAPQGQAIAYIGNSSLGYVSTSVTAPRFFYESILKDSVYNISEALRKTKLRMIQNYGTSGVYELFVLTNSLIGDPIINLPIPPKPNLYISGSNVVVINNAPTDKDDSLKIRIDYFNYGKVIEANYKVEVKQYYEDSLNSEQVYVHSVPLYKNSFTTAVPIKGLAGKHKIIIKLDADNEIAELNEADNLFEIEVNVASSSVRVLTSNRIEREVKERLLFLNPGSPPSFQSIDVELDTNEDFVNATVKTVPFDTVSTKLFIDSLENGERYWFRMKLHGDQNFGTIHSFIKGEKDAYTLADSIGFYLGIVKNLTYKNLHGLYLDSTGVEFEVYSAGFHDGRSANIMVNHVNYIPDNTVIGHHVCVFKDSTFEFVEYRRFNVYGGGTASTDYINFLDTLNSNYIVAFAISDEGRVTNTALRELIKSFGSKYIDSLTFRSSWGLIGKRGAVSGSMPEAFKHAFAGPVTINKSFELRYDSGSLLTSRIGPAESWGQLIVNEDLRSTSEIKYKPIGVKSDGSMDTLNYLSFSGNIADLSGISNEYRFLHLLAEFQASPDTTSPELKSMSVIYKGLAELALNYQSLSIEKDTIYEGEKTQLFYRIDNVGESDADSVKLFIDLIKPDNSLRRLLDTTITRLISEENIFGTFSYIPLSSEKDGDYKFEVKLDPENRIMEIYEDNNSQNISFTVLKDTNIISVSESSFEITFDGEEILDGDFVSNNPQIKMTLNYPIWFPVDDTTAIEIYIGERVYYKDLELNFDTIGRKITYSYKPILNKGEYHLKVFGKNSYGQLNQSPGLERVFKVADEMNLVNLFNYPNPFSNNTYFTFILTQLPDDLSIKVYSVAGRLIKDITLPASELNVNFNRIEWDGRDQDGDLLANGVYFYKVIITKGDKTDTVIQKLAIVR